MGLAETQCEALNNNTTVFVRVILNFGSQDALKVNVQQRGGIATIRFCRNLLDRAGL